MKNKTALVLGGTVYLVPELASGYDVQVVSLDSVVSDHPHISYTRRTRRT